MKRCFCFLFTIILLFTIIPLNAFAYGATPEYNELIELACEIFPEYETEIRAESNSHNVRTTSADADEIVYRETRSISDNESLGITVMSSGDIILLKNSLVQAVLTGTTSNSTDITNIGVSGTASFTIAYNGRIFKLSNVQYTIYYYSSDYFTNYGTVTTCTFYGHAVDHESSNSIRRFIKLSANAQDFYIFDLYFSNNKLVAELN